VVAAYQGECDIIEVKEEDGWVRITAQKQA